MTGSTNSQTGPFLHDSANVAELRFESKEGVDRSFTILIAEDYEGAGSPEKHLGIAVLDNDNGLVVFDGLDSDQGRTSAVLMFRMAHFQSMDWSEFSEACRSNPRYRGDIPDIDKWTRHPLPGNAARQAALGLDREIDEDIRTTFLQDLDADPETPYSFPPVDRTGAEEEICSHLCFVGKNKTNIAWDIRMDMSWNRTGRVRGGAAVDPEFDHDWSVMVKRDPEIIAEACSRALSPYLSGPTAILDMEEYPCEFGLAGGKGGFLTLEKFAGYFLSATRDISLGARIARLSDQELVSLWAAIRVMDEETSRAQRISEMEAQLHRARLEMEQQDQMRRA